jgi:acetyl-CoA C-acetyltransferase
LPPEVSALTVNMVCGSGLRAVALAAQNVNARRCGFRRRGRNGINVEHSVCDADARDGFGWANQSVVDLMIHDGLWCPFENWHMGNTGEVVAEKYRSGARSRTNTLTIRTAKRTKRRKPDAFKDEIVPIEIPQKKGDPDCFYDETFAKMRRSKFSEN